MRWWLRATSTRSATLVAQATEPPRGLCATSLHIGQPGLNPLHGHHVVEAGPGYASAPCTTNFAFPSMVTTREMPGSEAIQYDLPCCV